MTLLSLNPEYADKIDKNRFEFCNALVAALKGEAADLHAFGAEIVPPAIGDAKPVEEVARALLESQGASLLADEVRWPKEMANIREMTAKYPDYPNGHSLVLDALRDAEAALIRMRRLGFINDIGLAAIKAEKAE